LIKKNRYKERDFDKKELPAKREEKLKKIRSENNDKRDTNKKILEEKKSKIASTKYSEKNIINQMKSELQNNELEYNNKIKAEIQSNVEEYDNQFNNNQIELSIKTREVEAIRDLIKQNKDEHKIQIQQITQEAKDVRQKHFDEFEAKKSDLEGNKNELEGKIKSLEISQKEDGEALKWLNEQVIFEIKSNIEELSKKIDELRVHYTHLIKKQKEEKEKLKQAGDDLIFELKKIEEETFRQEKHKEKNNENKKKAEEELKNMTKRITDIENKIIECKKAHTYLEKCKFVLSYKIQELKKEAGPMEKVLEDLQKRTKEDELSLSKYNREFDIISQKLVDLEDLKEKNLENKKKAEDELIKITKRISDIENKIIECKKGHTYLEKCKFVLSYKIQELKKEAGPMEKVLEDLQLRTKEDELSLSKYNREFDIISQKLVNLDDLKEKTKTHEKTEHDLKNEINAFKLDLFNMLPFIDDYDKLREGFRNLRDKYLKTYVPEIQDHELESEFANQKAKMKNRVTELKKTLDTLKQQHKESIFENRYKNNEMIRKIETLKSTIKKVKKTKETINGDQKHANAVAEIFAAQTVKKLMMENISVKDKIKVFEEKIKSKKEELAYLKKNIHIDQVYFEDRLDIDEESKEDENDGEDNDNPDQEQEDNYVDSV
jgi:chromosome segregation ATPase